MQARLDQFLNLTLANAPPEKEFKFANFPSYWVFYGSAGRALTMWKLYINYKDTDPEKANYYVNKAKEYIDGSLSRMRYDRDDAVGFLEGNAGVFAIAAVVYDSVGYYDYARPFVQEIVDTLKRYNRTN